MTSGRLAFPIRSAAAALVLLAGAAQADQGFYLGAIGGVVLSPDATVRIADNNGNMASTTAFFDPGPAGSLVAGYTLANGLRPELELGYRRSDFENVGGHHSASQATASVYYNFSRKGYYFYLGGGAGYADVRFKLDGLGKDDDGVAIYSVGSGFGLPVGKRLMIGVDYRYAAGFERNHYDYSFDGTPLTSTCRYRNHVVGLGLRYSFGSALADSHPVRPSEPVSVVPAGN